MSWGGGFLGHWDVWIATAFACAGGASAHTATAEGARSGSVGKAIGASRMRDATTESNHGSSAHTGLSVGSSEGG